MNNPKKVHCFFEQSGTFKNEFIKLGIPAEDYDILNDFGQTDHVIDLFAEIEKAYDGRPSVFDEVGGDDLIMAFFPCIRFEAQILLWFRGEAKQQKKYTQIQKLEKDMELHSELHRNYMLITKFACVCRRKNLKAIIENPYTEQHYLTRYWCEKPSIIDNDRTERGDHFKKPTQYWFINTEPKCNFIFEPFEYVEIMQVVKHLWGTKKEDVGMRSMIHPQYANRFIREFIIEGEK